MKACRELESYIEDSLKVANSFNLDNRIAEERHLC
jgi:hypothetical protein